ncbi:MAG TPA: lipopolysaccharide kinase InaA family protein [Myxococcota bacterium]
MTTGWERREADGVRWIYRAAARAELDAALPGLRDRLGPPLPHARVRRHRSFHRVASPQGGLFVKRLAYPKLDLSLWLRVALSRVRGVREFRNAVRAHARGAPVVEPLAFGVSVRPRRGYESLLVYRLLPEGSRTLAEIGFDSLPRERREETLAALARLAADLHERGVYHLDLTPMNVVRTGGSDAEPALIAVDLETIRLGGLQPRRLAGRSLARIDERFAFACDEERERFRAAYRARSAGA